MEAYLDHAASTPVRPEVVEAVASHLSNDYGNPSGAHGPARRARRAVDEARDQVAELCGASPSEVVFTSGGTEADDLAISGVLDATGGVGVCSAIEHHAVLDAVLARGGRTVTVGATGVVDLDALAGVLDDDVAIVSVMLANNEIGTVQPLDAVIDVVRRRSPDAVVHTDAVQAAAWLDVSTLAANADLISLSAHKLGGPKGVGALVVRSGVRLDPRLRGGGQEHGRRSGTHNVAGIVGFGVASRLLGEHRVEDARRVEALRDRLASGITAAVPAATLTLPETTERLSSICHVCIEGIDSESLLFLLDDAGVSASAASSCASGALESSHVLDAIGVPPGRAAGALRLSLGWTSTEAEVDHAVTSLAAAVTQLARFAERSA